MIEYEGSIEKFLEDNPPHHHSVEFLNERIKRLEGIWEDGWMNINIEGQYFVSYALRISAVDLGEAWGRRMTDFKPVYYPGIEGQQGEE